jgi:hypothetical protein
MDDYKAIARYENVIKRRTADSWNPDQERILRVWAEKASGWAWLHDHSSRHYNSLTNRFTYPSILLSTVAGGLGFSVAGNQCDTSSSAKSIGMVQGMVYFIGGMNILSAMLASLQKFIRSTEKAEMHMHMNKVFSSFSRRIVLELALQPGDRKDCIEFCKYCRDEYDKLVTDSPQIPAKIIDLFKATFRNARHIPEVANGLIHFETFTPTNEGSKHQAFIAMRAFYKWKSKIPFRGMGGPGGGGVEGIEGNRIPQLDIGSHDIDTVHVTSDISNSNTSSDTRDSRGFDI